MAEQSDVSGRIGISKFERKKGQMWKSLGYSFVKSSKYPPKETKVGGSITPLSQNGQVT
jgi:hypothetical protein